MSLWLPSIYFPHRQYISLFCHFFPAISHQYRPIPTFFLGRPAANPAATQSVREGSQQPAAAAFPLHPRLHPHPPAPPVRPAFFSVCHQVLARNQLFAAPPSGRGRGRPDNHPDFPPNSAAKKAADTEPTFPDILIAAATGEGAVRRRQCMTVGHPAEPWLALAGQPLLIKNLENNFLCRMKPFHVFNSEKSPLRCHSYLFWSPLLTSVYFAFSLRHNSIHRNLSTEFLKVCNVHH